MNSIRHMCAAGLLLAGLGISAASAQTLRPFDRASRDASFLKFRTALIAALKRGDINYVIAQASPRIMLGFGGANGRVNFRKNLVGDKNLHGPGMKEEAADYRRALLRVLRLGGAFVRDKRGLSFLAPYVEAYGTLIAQAKRQGRKIKDPTAGWDAYETAFIIRANVAVHEYPNRFSKVLTRFSYRMVRLGKPTILRRLPHNRSKHLWQSVRLGKGRLGWIRPTDYHQPVGYRAEFRKRGGRWQITRFLAGD